MLNELDRITGHGKAEPLAVYELVAAAKDAGPAERDYLTAYAAGLADYRAGRFAEAMRRWQGIEHPGHAAAGAPTPPRVMAARAAEMLEDPPPAGWDGVWVKTSK